MSVGDSKVPLDSGPRSPVPGPVFALVAGEDSGDQLGAELIEALRITYRNARFVGVGGPRMRAVGFEAWHDIAELSVMGLAEVVPHLPRLLRLRASLTERLLRLKPAVLIGIDAPDFNLALEKKVKRARIRTVHYVSPSVWAWREHRAKKIGESADRVLCLFPMEPAIYARHGVDARFVGHPLADRFPLLNDRAAARHELGLAQDAPVLAVLPGSRRGEIHRLGAIFLDAAARVRSEIANLQIVVPAANERCHKLLQELVAKSGSREPGAGEKPRSSPAPSSLFPAPLLLNGHAHRAMAAADVVLLASGTAALEAMLAKRPMVAAYRLSALTYCAVRALKLLQTDVYTLPNILARAEGVSEQTLVPEFMQHECTAENLAAEVLRLFHEPGRRAARVNAFERMHLSLHAGGGAAAAAARAIGELLPTH